MRRKARKIVLQALYEIDCAGHNPDTVINRWLNEASFDEDTTRFLIVLVRGVLKYQTSLDVIIQQHAPEWPVDQMAIVDRNILRLAVYELADAPDTPLKVVINEAVELAKTYGSDSAPRFVNGVLGTLADKQATLLELLEKGTV